MHVGKRHPEVLVATVVTFLAVSVLLAVARFYDQMPIKAPSCRFREVFSIPCISCGGTRAFKAFAHGNWAEAMRFNPAAILGILIATLWLVRGIHRFRKGDEPTPPEKSRKQILRNCIIAGILLFINWIYLFFFLP